MQFESLLPAGLERILETAPIAYVPLGTLEFHGWHLPFGFDALKAHAICRLLQEQTGGTVLPPSYFGFSGGHADYPGSIITGESAFRANLARTFERLHDMGFRTVVALTGHYPNEQVEATAETASAFNKRFTGCTFIGLSEPDAYPGEFRGDHAAKWETSIALHLMPEAVDFAAMESREDPLHGICGEDPRTTASPALGKETVDAIIETLLKQVKRALAQQQ